jgi:hypothetical protein
VYFWKFVHVKGKQGGMQGDAVACDKVAQTVSERQRGKHPTRVFVFRREYSEAKITGIFEALERVRMNRTVSILV